MMQSRVCDRVHLGNRHKCMKHFTSLSQTVLYLDTHSQQDFLQLLDHVSC